MNEPMWLSLLASAILAVVACVVGRSARQAARLRPLEVPSRRVRRRR